jgi:calcineurin-like phosphoesterase family protein
MRYFTADTHFNHPFICDLRNFKTVEEHDEFIIKTWNSYVGKHDEVWHLGDFCFGGHDIVKRARARLNGKIHLVLGNHDYKNRIYNIRDCFTSFNDIKEIKLDKGRMIVLCHYAMRVWSRSHYNSGQLYAHSHGRLQPLGKQWDVGLDNNQFRLLTDMDIKQIMHKLPDNLNLLKHKKGIEW